MLCEFHPEATGVSGGSLLGVRVVPFDDGSVALTDEVLEMIITPEESGWWIVTNSRTDHRVRTDDTDVVARLWFCAANSDPPHVVCELVEPLTVQVTMLGIEHIIEAETPGLLRRATLALLKETSARFETDGG